MNHGMSPRPMASAYMQWVKTQTPAPYGLLTSGMLFCPLSFLKATLSDLEVNGPSFYGYQPLRNAVAQHCGVSPECVVLAEGTSMANHLVLATLLQAGDEVVIEDPTYELLVSLAGYVGAVVKRIPRRLENGFKVDPADLKRVVSSRTKLIILTNLHNPTSVYLSETELREIGSIARSVGAHVLVDEVYLEAKTPEVPASAFHLGPEFITTSSLTKVYGLNGLRCGWILAQPEWADRMWKLNDLFGVIPAHPAERISVLAFANMEALRDRSRSHLERNWASFRQIVGDHPAWTGAFPGYGTIVFPRLPLSDATNFCTDLRNQYGVSVIPGHFFGMPEHIRIGLGGDSKNVEQGLSQLKTALDVRFPAGAST